MVRALPLPSGLQEGTVIDGKYRVDKTLAAGAMGVVVLARHILLDERVAIKFLLPETLGNSDAVGRFLLEARAAIRIKSEHVVRVLDVATLGDDTPYIVMEYLEGNDLAEILSRRGPLPIDQAVELLLQACEAIAEAHELGIVHRDLKPANVFVVRRADGVYSAKVLDFGISKVLGGASNDISITDTKVVMGSPAYMSPEQMESARKVDVQTDVWALGAILCELVTGRIPFSGNSLAEVYTKIVSRPPPEIRTWFPGFSAGLEAVILKCLKVNRALRYQNVADLAVALQEFAPKRAVASIDRIARMLEASKKAASGVDPLAGAPWSPRSPLSSSTIAEKTLSSWGEPVPLPPIPMRKTRRARWVLAGAGGILLAVTVWSGARRAATQPALGIVSADRAGPVLTPPTATAGATSAPDTPLPSGISESASPRAPSEVDAASPSDSRAAAIPLVAHTRKSPPNVVGVGSAPSPKAPSVPHEAPTAAGEAASSPTPLAKSSVFDGSASVPPDLRALDLADPR